MVRISYFDFDEKAYPKKPKYLLVKREMLVNMEFATTLMQRAQSMSDNKFKVKEMYSWAMSYDKRIVINGVTVSSRKEYAHDFTGELFKLTSAIYLLVYKKNYEEGKIMQFLMDEQKNARDRGLFSMVWKYIAGIFSASIDLAKRCMIQPFYRLMFLGLEYKVEMIKCESQIEYANLVKRHYKPSCEEYLTKAVDLAADRVEYDPSDEIVSLSISKECVDRAVDEHVNKLVKQLEEREGIVSKQAPTVPTTSGISARGLLRCMESYRKLSTLKFKGDGNCQYYAVAAALGLRTDHQSMRQLICANYKGGDQQFRAKHSRNGE